MPLPIWISLTDAQIAALAASQSCMYGKKDKVIDVVSIMTEGMTPCSQVLIGVKKESL